MHIWIFFQKAHSLITYPKILSLNLVDFFHQELYYYHFRNIQSVSRKGLEVINISSLLKAILHTI